MRPFSLDHLTETEFEQFCYELLLALGFTNLNWRKGTGLATSPADRGRDIECQLVREDVDGETYLETWFVECKHYQKGVPSDAIQGALAWANAERPDKLLIIASNFLSNATKDYLKNYVKNNKPGFKIKHWERLNLETLTLDKVQLLSKYKLYDNSSLEENYVLTIFMQRVKDFERALRISLQAMGVILPENTFVSLKALWNLFVKETGILSKKHIKDVEELMVIRNKIAHGEPILDLLQGLTPLITRLEHVIQFVQNYSVSAEMLPALKEKYPQWVRPDIVSIRIVQKKQAVFLEVVTKTERHVLGDEDVKRTDLQFIADDSDPYQEGDFPPLFPTDRTAQENADWFLNYFDPYSIRMCTDLFITEA